MMARLPKNETMKPNETISIAIPSASNALFALVILAIMTFGQTFQDMWTNFYFKMSIRKRRISRAGVLVDNPTSGLVANSKWMKSWILFHEFS
jgi:hypothetical protein